MEITCPQCRTKWPVLGRISFKEECYKCATSIHVCRCCIFFDESYYNQCRESSAERVVDKEKANHCEFFQYRDVSSVLNKEDLKAKAESLFKK